MTPAPRPTPTLEQVMQLILQGNEESRARHEELRRDSDAKHEENRTARHKAREILDQTRNEMHLIDGRVRVLETQQVNVLGDGSGSTGKLNSIEKKVDELSRKVTSQMAVVAFCAFMLPLILGLVWEFLKYSHR
jgi:uncharacterized protein involved in exopolysaccharide biosynthesis